MRETFSPSDPKATCCIVDDYTEQCFVHWVFVRKQRDFIAGVVFTAVLIIAGGFLAVDAFRPSPLQHALMNVEGIVALSFIAVLFVRSSGSGGTTSTEGFDALHVAWAMAAIIVVVGLAFAPISAGAVALRRLHAHHGCVPIHVALRCTAVRASRRTRPVFPSGGLLLLLVELSLGASESSLVARQQYRAARNLQLSDVRTVP